MDLTRAVGYRGFPLNTLSRSGANVNWGCEILSVEWRPTPGVGYSEKRAMADGRDASDVYLDGRVLQFSGALYGVDRAHLYDLWQELKTVLTPTAAYDASPGDKGYLPLDFYVPTRNTESFPTGYIHQQVLARPLAQPATTFLSDAHGGDDAEPLSLRWTAAVDCRDPRVYAYDPTIYNMAGLTSDSGDLLNKGDYAAPLNVLLNVAPLAAQGTIHIVGAGSDLTITVPASVGVAQVIRYSAEKKVLTREVNGSEVLRMDLLSFAANKTHPLVLRGSTPYSWSRTGSVSLQTGSRIWHWDAWA